MPAPRLTINAVIQLAHQEARRLAAAPAGKQLHSPAMRQAVWLVWGLVKARLEHCDQLESLYRLIEQLTQPQSGHEGGRP